MNKLQQIFQLYHNMGGKYFAFRGWYELKRKSGFLKAQFPTSPANDTFITLDEWRKSAKPFFFSSRNDLNICKNPTKQLQQDCQRILNGEIQFFSHEWMSLGLDYDWVTNPDTGYKYDINKHWTEIEDIDLKAGDIKFTWEKSRFSFLYTIIRYDYHFDEDHSEFVFKSILDWIDKNPINQGPNYKCSQEISLRILNWTFALYFYRNSKFLREDVFQQIMHSVYWQILHVKENINFSRISVRNNHAITETLTLYLTSLLYPFFPESDDRKRNGKKWFEQEIAYQIYEDGTFLQFSMNYHRVVVQLLTWAIGIAELNGETYSDVVYERAYKSLDFLFQCQDSNSGWLPNYGANDGALFFKLSDNDYRDYRPQLDALHFLLTKDNLYEKGLEDREWYGVSIRKYPRIIKKYGCIEYPVSGYYLIREKDTLTFIHCGIYKDRPSQADNMHLDIWYRGENVLMDAGSYKYNTSADLVKYFNGSESHNTVMLDDNDQMLKGGRFIWYFWPKNAKARMSHDDAGFVFEGSVNCFLYLGQNIVHNRTIRKQKDVPLWTIEDEIVNKPTPSLLRQLWHTKSKRMEINAENVQKNVSDCWISDYYGEKEKAYELALETKDSKITTTIRIQE